MGGTMDSLRGELAAGFAEQAQQQQQQ